MKPSEQQPGEQGQRLEGGRAMPAKVAARLAGLDAMPGHEYVAAVLTDPSGRLVWVSRGFAQLSGLAEEAWEGQWAADALEPGGWPAITGDPEGAPDSPLTRRLRQPDEFVVEVTVPHLRSRRRWQVLTAWGQPQHDAQGHWIGHALRLMPDSRVRATMYRRDALTRLWDRAALEARWPSVLEGAAWRGLRVLVVLLDLDDFKAVNDAWGHATGDRVLASVARRLGAATPEKAGAWFRLGGDEFVGVYYAAGESDPAVQAWLKRCQAAVAAPLAVAASAVVRLEASLGLTWAEPDALRTEILHRADLAMYSAKAAKVSRTTWWRWWQPGIRPDTDDPGYVNPFGPASARMLSEAREALAPLSPRTVLEAHPMVRARSALMETLQAAFGEALAPATTDQAHAMRSRLVGERAALEGIDAATIAHVWTGWSHELTLLVLRLAWPPARKLALAEALAQRINASIDRQMLAHTHTLRAYQAALTAVQKALQGYTRWPDMAQAALRRIASLPGMRAALLTRPDAHGGWVVEFAEGEGAGIFSSEAGAALLGTTAQRRHWLATAWAAGRLTTRRDWSTTLPRAQRQQVGQLELRAAAAAPLRDGSGHPVAMLLLFGAIPGMFATPEIRLACTTLAAYLGDAWRRPDDRAGLAVPPLSQADRARYRQQLAAGQVLFVAQPVVRLVDGRVTKTELLARLLEPEGAVVMPGQFLRAFGQHELTKLFLAGLNAAVALAAQWRQLGKAIQVSLNLPMDVLALPECLDWVREALGDMPAAAEALELELLESSPGEGGDQAARTALAIRALGVGLAMDDLGAGYSGLQRLRQWPFTAAKVDWALVREVHHTPEQTVSFLGGLVHLVHDLGLSVVMEGLETPDLVEMALELGADYGQGYAIARPMPIERLGYRQPVEPWPYRPGSPVTELGRLAAAWSWRQAGGSSRAQPSSS